MGWPGIPHPYGAEQLTTTLAREASTPGAHVATDACRSREARSRSILRTICPRPGLRPVPHHPACEPIRPGDPHRRALRGVADELPATVPRQAECILRGSNAEFAGEPGAPASPASSHTRWTKPRASAHLAAKPVALRTGAGGGAQHTPAEETEVTGLRLVVPRGRSTASDNRRTARNRFPELLGLPGIPHPYRVDR